VEYLLCSLTTVKSTVNSMDMQGGHGQGQMAGGRMMPGNTQGNLPLQSPQGGILAPAQQHGQVPMSQAQLGHGGMGQQPPPPMQTHPVLPSPQAPGHGGVGGQESPKQDNISKAKTLMPTIKEAVAVIFLSSPSFESNSFLH